MISYKKNGSLNVQEGPIFTAKRGTQRAEYVWTVFERKFEVVLLSNYTEYGFLSRDSECIRSNCSQNIFVSFHSEQPTRLRSGLFNCSVATYSGFRHHVDCNMRRECEDGRDETERCPFSDAGCQGLVSLCNGCYSFVPDTALDKFNSIERNVDRRAEDYCQSLGGRLGIPKCTRNLYDAVLKYTEEYLFDFVYAMLGLYYNDRSLPNMYRGSVVDGEKVVLHNMVSSLFDQRKEKRLTGCFIYGFLGFDVVDCHVKTGIKWDNEMDVTLVCEFKGSNGSTQPVQLPSVSLPWHKHTQLTQCQDGQVIHTFLLCGQQGRVCQVHRHPCAFPDDFSGKTVHSVHSSGHGLLVPMFQCGDDGTVLALPVTLVCDFRPDCLNEEDESFCRHPPCVGHSFTCHNGQCVSYSGFCDKMTDCLDGSDERGCPADSSMLEEVRFVVYTSPAVVNFDGIGSFSSVKMKVNESCPDTHYRCHGDLKNDCLPLYTRCNGMYDCVGYEDEEGCEESVCPGFYKCRNSMMCLHGDHLCDGWPHCPLRDDELLCDPVCPPECLCYAHLFVCFQPFHARLYPQLRYLNATGSNMSLHCFTHNVYLIHLILSQCSLVSLPEIKLPNMLFLDLSMNKLQSVNMTVLACLENLQELSLGNNPLHLLLSGSSSVVKQNALKMIDLSYTDLLVMDGKVFSTFPSLEKLNLSFTKMHTIENDGFDFTPQLTTLSLDGNQINSFPSDLFENCPSLHTIFAPNYMFCCGVNIAERSCYAPEDEMSSCGDLLRSGSRRGFLWLMSFLSITGNVICSVTCVSKHRMTSSIVRIVFVVNLAVADFLMGVSTAILAVADGVYRGRYRWHAETWRRSFTCNLAAFLSVISYEISAFTTLLITLDCCITIRLFTCSRLRFDGGSAAAACVLSWTVGLIIGSVPLVSTGERWQLYGQTALCIPFPFGQSRSKGEVYFITVLIVFHFAVFLTNSAGQLFVYWSVRKAALPAAVIKVSKDLTLSRGRLTVSVVYSLCWFSVGLCLVFTLSSGRTDKTKGALAMTTFLMNSVLNPLIFTHCTLTEKLRKSREEKLEKWFKAHADILEIQSSAG